MLSNLMMQLGNHANAQLEENMIRHMVLNSLRSYKSKFGPEYGEIVIACDNKNYWRRQLFPYYKANRKKNQDKSELDWKAIFEILAKIREELKEFFGYRVIDVESAEADDIIGTLVKNFGSEIPMIGEKILILSGDKDFIQLHRYENVEQYDPVRKKKITHDNPELYLKTHIMKGDAGDGVPNILSADNCFVVGDRQKPLTQKKIDHLMGLEVSEYPDQTVARNYSRNQQLIDLDFIPSEIQTKIVEQYHAQGGKDRSKLMDYFIAHKLRNLIQFLPEF